MLLKINIKNLASYFMPAFTGGDNVCEGTEYIVVIAVNSNKFKVCYRSCTSLDK